MTIRSTDPPDGSDEHGPQSHDTDDAESTESRLGKALERTREVTGDVAKTAGDVSRSAFDATRELASKGAASAWEGARALGGQMRESLSDAVDRVGDLVLEEVTVPVFLLPTGSGPEDYFVLYSFRDAIERLKSGVLVRPRLEVWAGRADVHRPHLASVIQRTFLEQFRAERARAKIDAKRESRRQIERIEEAEREQRSAARRMRDATAVVTSSLLFMFFVANPLFDLVFLAMAVFGTGKGAGRALDYIRLSLRMGVDEAKIERRKKELERELDSRNEDFREAVENLELKIHPVLQQIVVDFAEADLRSHAPVAACDPEEAPDVENLLRDPGYVVAVPDWLRPIVEAHHS